MGLTNLIMGAFALIIIALLALKIVPSYLHSMQISHIFNEIVADPAMQDAPISAVEMSYRKRASINYIEDLKVEDIEIVREGGALSLSASYEVRIPLMGNVSLVLAFNPSSS
ncbi:DUF4845 domain-containing protein [Ferrigenium sp. UT5]|uniref:DUF4845 domain-containing protein n=1 Tax=Ferrigenium sp. UT5 TaxID=3242105 RepID=UPI0038B405F7